MTLQVVTARKVRKKLLVDQYLNYRTSDTMTVGDYVHMMEKYNDEVKMASNDRSTSEK